jgi:hypothetical protein
MKKQLVIIGIITLLVIVGLSGCTNNNNVSSETNEEKVLGGWTATIPDTPITVIMNFFTNGSYSESINKTVIWETYTITNETIALQSGVKTHMVKYSFSNNDKTLTLLEIDGGATYLVLTRQ